MRLVGEQLVFFSSFAMRDGSILTPLFPHSLSLFLQHLKLTLNNRLSRWREFRAQMSLRSKINFGLQLSQRGYSGELEFHHSNKTLTIRVSFFSFFFLSTANPT